MEKNEKQQDVIEEVEMVEVEETKAVRPAKQRLLWLAIFVLLGLLAGLFWFVQQQQKLQQVEVKQLAQSLTKQIAVASQSDGVLQLKQSIAAKTKTTFKLFETLNTIDKDLAEKLDKIARAQQLTNDDVLRTWAVAEIEFLLQAANQSVLLAGNIENARTALTLADHRLVALADPRFYRLRVLISDEDLALAAVAKIDIEGLATQLQSAIDSVETLQILTGSEPVVDDLEVDATTLSGNWETLWSGAWQQVKSLVVIRHQQDGATAILVPEQQYFLYQNLRLKLETARFALISGREPIFYTSLLSAEQWLQRYFTGGERDAMLVIVRALQSEQIKRELPDISASLRWLQQQGAPQ